MAKVTYGKFFRTRRGSYGRYKYVNGRKVAFVRAGRTPQKKPWTYRNRNYWNK